MMHNDIPNAVSVVEVGPRDGLQNESTPLSIANKVSLVNALSKTGLKRIEAASFVSPKWVPQMASSDEVLAKLSRAPGVIYSALTPNMRGFNDAIAAGADEVAVFGAASESFSQKNINCSVDESLKRFEPVIAAAQQANVPVRGYVSCVLGCPYEGDIAAQAVLDVSLALLNMGCYEVSLGDTIGVGTPLKTASLLSLLLSRIPSSKLALHMHDTYGQALANVFAGLQQGIATVDASVSGLGGCPYANGASGNLATEDLIYMLDGMDVHSGVDIKVLSKVGNEISTILGRKNGSKTGLALLAQ